jgi:cystathionine gamma-synthase
VDNTFATPANQRPLESGADAVVHSTTKYLGGHSDVVGGAVVTSDPDLHERVRFVQNSVGAVPGPFDCFLVTGAAHAAPARRRAHRERPSGGRGAARGPWRHRRALAGLRRHGRLPPPRRDADRRRTELFTLAESLGGVESLIEVPQAMTHQSVEGSDAAVPADLVRLSVGVEAAQDLVDDLLRAIRT